MKSQIIIAIACLAVGFGSAAVLYGDFAFMRAEAATSQQCGGGQPGQQQSQTDGGGHTHGPRPPEGSQGAAKIEKFLADMSRRMDLTTQERGDLRYALRQQNFHVRRGLQNLQRTLVRYSHAPASEKADLRVLVIAEVEAVMDTVDWGRSQLLGKLSEQNQLLFVAGEADQSIYFYWLGE